MAEDQEDISPVDVEREEEEGYQPPPEKSIDEILEADQVPALPAQTVVAVVLI